MLNTDPAAFDAVSGEGAGIATNMTGIATVHRVKSWQRKFLHYTLARQGGAERGRGRGRRRFYAQATGCRQDQTGRTDARRQSKPSDRCTRPAERSEELKVWAV